MSRAAQLIAFCLAVVSFSASAEQDITSGNFWLRMCEGKETWEQGACTFYASGLHDGILLQQSLSGTNKLLCIPPGVTKGQIKDIWVKAMKDNPAQRHEQGDLIFAAAVSAAYPCKKGK
ncbi:Rap1a/Tai family immunity protein [Achromobacter sp.]|uniref:Rap1a/Tai family immunity protein n=1 Tax=Achromobacter sp. TaxID=134375 RepID=UPI0028B1D6AB|nr:Rap1a/Tai family immunity protein [Achromobacter sp.]